MELTGAALRRSLPAVPGGRRRPRASRVACARGGFAEEGHLRYYEAGAARKAVGARDLPRVRAVGLVAGDAAKGKEATDLLSKQLNQMEYTIKQARKQEKAAMKALKKQKKKAAAMMMSCEDGSSSESSESDCEDEQVIETGQGMVVVMVSTTASELGAASGTSMVCDKAAMKAAKKMEKEQKKAAKKAMKKMKEAKKMATMNGCRDEDSSSSSSESSESECEGEVLRMSRCTKIKAPQQPTSSTTFPIVVPQLPESGPPELLQAPRMSSESPTPATQCTTSVAVVEKPMANRIEVCMGGKCKKSGALALLQEFEKVVGTGGAAVGCKCLGKCGLGPNVRLRSEGSAPDGSVKKNPLCIGVGLEDVGTIVTGLFGDSDLGMTPA